MFLFKKTNISECSGVRLDHKRETVSPATENTLSAGVDDCLEFSIEAFRQGDLFTCFNPEPPASEPPAPTLLLAIFINFFQSRGYPQANEVQKI